MTDSQRRIPGRAAVMTAEEHLREAEYWLNTIKGLHARRLRKYRAECIAKAQAHATAALAVATMERKQQANQEAS